MPSKLVDMFTYDRELESLMLSDYPGRLIPETQHLVDKAEEEHLYCFFNLSKSLVLTFLKSYIFEYELRDSETGAILNQPYKQAQQN